MQPVTNTITRSQLVPICQPFNNKRADLVNVSKSLKYKEIVAHRTWLIMYVLGPFSFATC